MCSANNDSYKSLVSNEQQILQDYPVEEDHPDDYSPRDGSYSGRSYRPRAIMRPIVMDKRVRQRQRQKSSRNFTELIEQALALPESE